MSFSLTIHDSTHPNQKSIITRVSLSLRKKTFIHHFHLISLPRLLFAHIPMLITADLKKISALRTLGRLFPIKNHSFSSNPARVRPVGARVHVAGRSLRQRLIIVLGWLTCQFYSEMYFGIAWFKTGDNLTK